MVKCFSKSKNMKKLLPIFIALFLCTGCDQEEVTVDCLEQTLSDLDMVPYSGQDIGCTFFVHQYTFQEKQYYLLDNYCVDAAYSPVDCEGNSICNGDNLQLCNDFYSNAVYHGVVGISL